MASGSSDEVYYCGSCRRQQQANAENEKYRNCKKQTVSCFTNREAEAEARRKWKQVNGQ